MNRSQEIYFQARTQHKLGYAVVICIQPDVTTLWESVPLFTLSPRWEKWGIFQFILGAEGNINIMPQVETCPDLSQSSTKVEGVEWTWELLSFYLWIFTWWMSLFLKCMALKCFGASWIKWKPWGTEIGYQLLAFAYRIHFARVSASILLCTFFARRLSGKVENLLDLESCKMDFRLVIMD